MKLMPGTFHTEQEKENSIILILHGCIEDRKFVHLADKLLHLKTVQE